MDDFVERLWKTLAFVSVAFLLIYFLLATSSEKPTGLSLVIFTTMNQMFYWLLRLLAVGIISCILFFVYFLYSNAQIEPKRKLQEEEAKRDKQLRAIALEAEVDKVNRLNDEAKAQKKREAKLEQQNRISEREEYLKNRSAKDANDEALKNLL